jgi:hypothetical protein
MSDAVETLAVHDDDVPRTIVYDPPVLQAAVHRVTEASAVTPGPIAPFQRRRLRLEAEAEVAKAPKEDVPVSTGTSSRDDYFSRIAKYIPAEMITLTTMGFAAFVPAGSVVGLWVASGALANVIYLLGMGVSGDPAQRPRWFFYVLSVPAYVLWATATIDAVGAVIGVSGSGADAKKAFVLAAAAFIIPALDVFLEHLGRGGQAVKKEAAKAGQAAPPKSAQNTAPTTQQRLAARFGY